MKRLYKGVSETLDSTLKYFFDKLTLEEKYKCILGIPGEFLELRSGYFPAGVDTEKDFRDYLVKIANIDLSKLKKESIKNIEYKFLDIFSKYDEIIPDDKDKYLLFSNYLKFLSQKNEGIANMENYTDKVNITNFFIKDRDIKISYPDDIVSLGLIWEVFGEEVYYFDKPVQHIYDFGANIGLSTIYFNLLNPEAKITCIEPLEKNIKLLKKNLKDNSISAEIIEGAVGEKDGEMKLFFSDQSHALPSTSIRQTQNQIVRIFPIDKIVKEKNYGLKIDIEGSESYFHKFPNVIANATWIVGELHYSKNKKENKKIDIFFEIIKKNFMIKESRPVIYFVGEEAILCKSFKTIKKLDIKK